MTTAAVLMDVLEQVESEHFQAALAAAPERPDGCRPPLWRVRFDLAHALPASHETPWFMELEHSLAHVMGAGDAEDLRAALVHHAALTAAWIQDLDGREAGE